ncbi:MAG: hypothetical protein ACFB4J_00955 [Elainellaceae cyanobacterium]
MSEVRPAEIDAHNQESLAQLCRLLWLSQGEFELILAVCNSTSHRQALVEQLRQQCSVSFQTLTLKPETTTLFTTIQQQLTQPWPEALMVFGLEDVQDLEQVLTATNQIREEFRQFTFPLVIWLPDDTLKPLIRKAPDFYTWANPVAFQTPPAFFLTFLDDLIQEVWHNVLNSWESHFLSSQELGLVPGSPRCRELEASLTLLKERNIALDPAQSAALEFVRGRVSDNNTEEAREHYERSIDQWRSLLHQKRQAQNGQSVNQSQNGQKQNGHSLTQTQWRESLGHVQFYLGLWWRNQAERDRRRFTPCCQQACEYFKAAEQTFEAAGREDLAAKYINYWAESLYCLGRWSGLEQVATRAVALHEGQQIPFRVARAKGFLAEVALWRGDGATARAFAEAALALIESEAELEALKNTGGSIDLYNWVNSFHRSAYLYSLGKALLLLGEVDGAVDTLEQACRVTQPEYGPWLYGRILEALRQGYFDQGEYFRAFETRRRKDAIESQFNYRAFIGAARLRPRHQLTNPALPARKSKDAIATSGRKQDVERLLKRLVQVESVLTIVYGPSGVGKSSLLEAGLMPLLKQERFETRRVVPVYVRRYRDWAGELTSVVCPKGEEDLDALETPLNPPLLRGEAPVLPLNKGELEGVNQPVEPVPNSSEKEPTPNPSEEGRVFGALRDRTQDRQVIVLIFDQFEEFFFEFDQPADRRPFYDFLRDCLSTPYIKVVLSMREDYIHHLLECDRLTDLSIIDNNILDKKWLYYLGNFTPEDTKTVITDLTDPTPYAPEAARVDQVVEDLAGVAGEVRPIELQVVGAQLQAERITTPEAYRNWGDPSLPTKELLVQNYLTDIVRECGPEENQRLADVVLYLLTDEKGTRPLKTESDLAGDAQALSQAEAGREALGLVLRILTRSGLVMAVPELPEDRYQLVHDYLAAFIRSTQQPVMAQLEEERRMRREAEEGRFAEQRRRLRLARRAVAGLTAVSLVAIGGGAVAWVQRQRAVRGEVNAQFVSESLKMVSLVDSGQGQNDLAPKKWTLQKRG